MRGVPPVVNEPGATALLGRARRAACSARTAPCRPTQSLGGEDFAWYLDGSPARWAGSAPARPGGRTYDLHQGDLRVDERAIGVGAKVLAAAVTTLDATTPRSRSSGRRGQRFGQLLPTITLPRRRERPRRALRPGLGCAGLRLDSGAQNEEASCVG